MPHHIILDDMDAKWELLTETDSLQAELIKSYLEAQGIEVMLLQEAAGKAYGLTVGPLGLVQLLVPVENLEGAHEVMDAFFADSSSDEAAEEN